MQRALIVVEPVEATKEFVAEAGEIAANSGAELLLLHVASESEFEDTRKALSEFTRTEGGSYDVSQAEAGARQLAAEVGREVFGDGGPDFEPLGAVGDKADHILRTVRERDCDHVFLAGRKRSPSGKAIFGDAAQRVILNADVPVTVTTYEESSL